LSGGDTNTGIPSIEFSKGATKRLRNICKLATLFVKYVVDERWMRILIDVDLSDDTSQALSLERYRECVIDRLGGKGQELFDEIVRGMNLVY
jgi:hypothetical protein